MATPRPRPQVMRLTDAAANRIKEILARAETPIAGVRVGVKNGGCAGASSASSAMATMAPRRELASMRSSRWRNRPWRRF